MLKVGDLVTVVGADTEYEVLDPHAHFPRVLVVEVEFPRPSPVLVLHTNLEAVRDPQD